VLGDGEFLALATRSRSWGKRVLASNDPTVSFLVRRRWLVFVDPPSSAQWGRPHYTSAALRHRLNPLAAEPKWRCHSDPHLSGIRAAHSGCATPGVHLAAFGDRTRAWWFVEARHAVRVLGSPDLLGSPDHGRIKTAWSSAPHTVPGRNSPTCRRGPIVRG
jgi:hypothetical protein